MHVITDDLKPLMSIQGLLRLSGTWDLRTLCGTLSTLTVRTSHILPKERKDKKKYIFINF